MALKPASKKYAGVWTNDLKNGNVAYYINYRDEFGKPVKKKVGVKTQQSNYTVKDAYDRLIEVKHKLSTGDELTLKPQRKKKLPFSEVFEQYIEAAKLTKKTWKDDLSIYNVHLSVFAQRDIKSLKLKDFEELQQAKVKDVSEKTVNNILATARQIINYAIKYELVNNYINPISSGKLKMFKPDNQRNNFFTKEQAKQLLIDLQEHTNISLYRLTVLLLYTGARFSEVTGLRWSDINLDTKMEW
ncbi:MAG: tyrosine-type recombinase/integrase [Helicobacteraceae bacterium]|nr:tyrosine-type recombinase/integrase [Helicobacteraceae bacterium]